MEYLNLTDMARLFQVMHRLNKRDHLVALTCFFTGARVSEVLALKGEDIFQSNGKWVVYIRAQKGSDNTLKTLHADADPAFDMTPLIALAARKGPSVLLFGGAHLSNFNTKLKVYAAAAEIHSMYAHSHVFRKSAAMCIMERTQRVGAVQKFLGHKSASSTMIYLQENDGRYAQDVMDNLNLAVAQ